MHTCVCKTLDIRSCVRCTFAFVPTHLRTECVFVWWVGIFVHRMCFCTVGGNQGVCIGDSKGKEMVGGGIWGDVYEGQGCMEGVGR